MKHRNRKTGNKTLRTVKNINNNYYQKPEKTKQSKANLKPEKRKHTAIARKKKKSKKHASKKKKRLENRQEIELLQEKRIYIFSLISLFLL